MQDLSDACLAMQNVPDGMVPGHVLEHGIFYRNLQKNDVAWLYPEETAEFGRRLKRFEKWNWTDGSSQMDFSVNLATCVGSPCCSLHSHPQFKSHEHVWEFDLDNLNDCSSGIEDSYVAQYTPDPPNRCHFVIVPLNGILSHTQFVALLKSMLEEFPPTDRLPQNKGNHPPKGSEPQAKEALKRYQRLVCIYDSPCRDYQIPALPTGGGA